MPVLAWMAGLLALAFAMPAQAARYNYCKLFAGAEKLPIARTFDETGALRFQSSLALPVMAHGDSRLRAYLVWPDGKAAAAPRLWIVHVQLGHEGIVNGSDRVMATPKTKPKMPPVFLGTGEEKGDYSIFELDPVALLARFPDAPKIELSFESAFPEVKIEQRYRLREQLDLMRLRQLAGLEYSGLVPTCTAPLGAEPPEEVNIAAYQDCQWSLTEGAQYFGVSESRVQWQYHPSKSFYFGADRTIYSGESESEFAEAMAMPFAGKTPIWLRLIPQLYDKGDHGFELALRFRFSAGGKLYAPKPGKYAETEGDWAQLLALEATGKPVHLKVTKPDGTIVGELDLPPELFAGVQSRLQEGRAKILEYQKDPIRHCAPYSSIIVT